MGPCQSIPRHTLGIGVGLVALDWQDQLLAQPCPSPQCCPHQGPVYPRPSLYQAGAFRGGAGMDGV